MQKQPRPKSKFDALTGISARMPDAEVAKYKEMMTTLKSKHGAGFSLSDLVQVVIMMDRDLLNKEIAKYKALQSISVAFVKKLDISDDAKSKIEAILAEEAMKKG